LKKKNIQNNRSNEVSIKISDYISELFGLEASDKYKALTLFHPSQFLRVNRLKTNSDSIQKSLLINYGIETEKVGELPFVLKVTKGEELTGKTVEHICGAYYIQSLSSMLPPLVLNPTKEDTTLDLCAAPGSKSTQLSEMMENKGTLILNEIQMDRVKSLVFNIDRLNILNAGVIHNRGEWLSCIYNEYFDKVLVDAPCSGLGIIQKKSEISDWWSKEKLVNLSELQFKLIVSAFKMLKPGGELVYSTCTLTLEENEFIINKLIDKYPCELLPIDLPFEHRNGFTEAKGIEMSSELIKTIRLNPWEFSSEGFFIAKIRKTGSIDASKTMTFQKNKMSFMENKELELQFRFLNEVFGIPVEVFSNYKYFNKSNDIFFADKDWYDENPDSFNRIGNKFGTIDRNGNIILHTQAVQAVSDHITKNIYKISDKSELRSYLSGGTFKSDCKYTGQIAIKYGDLMLGNALINDGNIKSRFPRSKRTQEITI